MVQLLFSHDDATPEDLLIQTKWARRLAIVYGVVLLLLVAFLAANHMLAEPKAAPGLANAAKPHVARVAQPRG